MIWFAVWIGLSWIVGRLCADKKIGFWGGFFFSIFLSPLIGFIISMVAADAEIDSE
jgi:uncharacterized membrane protein